MTLLVLKVADSWSMRSMKLTNFIVEKITIPESQIPLKQTQAVTQPLTWLPAESEGKTVCACVCVLHCSVSVCISSEADTDSAGTPSTCHCVSHIYTNSLYRSTPQKSWLLLKTRLMALKEGVAEHFKLHWFWIDLPVYVNSDFFTANQTFIRLGDVRSFFSSSSFFLWHT